MIIGELIDEEFKRITQAYTTRSRINELFKDNPNSAYHIRYKDVKLSRKNIYLVKGLLEESLRCVRNARENEDSIVKMLDQIKLIK
jgi:hypothetical protein